MTAIAQLKALLGIDNAQFKAGMRDATSSTKSFQKAIGEIGRAIGVSFSIGAIIAFGKAVVDWAGKLSEAAENTGMLTSEMMAFNRVAIQTGNDADTVVKVIGKIKTEMDKAIRGSEESREKFDRLGLSMKDLAAMSPAEQLMAVMQAAKETGQPLEAMARIVGEDLGPRFVKFINQATGPDGVPKLSAELGKAADAAERFGSRQAEAMDKVKGGALDAWMWINEQFEKTFDAMLGGLDYAAAEAQKRASGPENAGRTQAQQDAIKANQDALEKATQDELAAIDNRIEAERVKHLEGEEKM